MESTSKKLEKAQKAIEKKAKKAAKSTASAPSAPSGVIKEPKRTKAVAVAAPPKLDEDRPDVETRSLPTWPTVAAWLLQLRFCLILG